MHVDRFIVELLRPIVVAVQDGDVGKDQQRAAMLHFVAAGIGGFSRLQRDVRQPARGRRAQTRRAPEETARTDTTQASPSSRPNDSASVASVPPRRDALGSSACAPDRSTPAPAAIPARDRRASACSSQSFPSSNWPRFVQNQNSAPASSTPFSARVGDVRAHSSAARTFSCSIRSRRRHAS